MEEKEIKNIEFSVADAYSLPFDKEIFDTVICNNALHNMITESGFSITKKEIMKHPEDMIQILYIVAERRKNNEELTRSE